VQLAQARPSPIVPVASGPLAARLGVGDRFCASGPHYVQVGAFGSGAAVRAVTQRLAGSGRLAVEPLFAGGQALARVKLGPFPSPDAALPLLDRVRGLGYREAVLVPAAGGSPAPACTRTAMLVPSVR
jgi:rare lipoprotein A